MPASITFNQQNAIIGFVFHVLGIFSIAIFLAWKYLPKDILDSIGLFYLPHKLWTDLVLIMLISIFALCLISYFLLMYLTMPDKFSISHIEVSNSAYLNVYLKKHGRLINDGDIDDIPPQGFVATHCSNQMLDWN
ncbi:hypothetical protein GJ496_005448 [Pomphorhynchus laevis]|nr:hypothetical protein GJ496_005448 [Pomphorhynchus laevis]